MTSVLTKKLLISSLLILALIPAMLSTVTTIGSASRAGGGHSTDHEGHTKPDPQVDRDPRTATVQLNATSTTSTYTS
ncbi:MAG: hypothetical protein WB643_03775 [Candidatus Bathyarchaeia archaeon]